MFDFLTLMTTAEEEAMANVIAVVLIFYIGIILFALALSAVMYVFQSIGLYTVAKRRRIKSPWLAWIPVGNSYIVGCLSDQYKREMKNKATSRRKILLGLYIAEIALLIPFYAIYIGFALSSFGAEPSLSQSGPIAFMLMFLFISLGITVISIVFAVFFYMSYYDIYASCSPDSAVILLVVSILFSVAAPFIMFALRNKDDGIVIREQD